IKYVKIICQVTSKNSEDVIKIYYNGKDNIFNDQNCIIIGNTNESVNKQYVKFENRQTILRLGPVVKQTEFNIKSIQFIPASNIEYYIQLNRDRFIKSIKLIKTNPLLIMRFLYEYRRRGLKAALKKVLNKINDQHDKIKYNFNRKFDIDNIKKKIDQFEYMPLISVIMPVYNIDPKWFELAVKSVQDQFYPNWELCIADDCSTNKKTREYLESIDNNRIKIKFCKTNQGIAEASNEAASLAKGEYIALLDNDDELTPDALYEVVKIINEKGAEFIYSDEDKITPNGKFVEPHFKPDYSPDLFLSQNYICHLCVIKKNLFDNVCGFRNGFQGSQDHDLQLRAVERTNKIYHIPKVLYHWRKIPGSTADKFHSKSYAWDAGRKAIEEALKRRNIEGEVYLGKYPGSYRVKRKIINNSLISIIIPFNDKPELLEKCINSILKKSTYTNIEIICISNNSIESKTFDIIKYYKEYDKRIKFFEYNIPFNYSKINNYAVSHTNGTHIILLNNDIEIISPDWIEGLLEHSQRPEVGAVGAKLYYPNNTIQHAGIIVGIFGNAGHSHKLFNKNEVGYYARPHIIQNISAVTGACLMVKKSVYLDVGGLNEEELSIAYNDVDFCLRLREKGYLNVFTPYCEAYHHESLSRGGEDTRDKLKRFQNEIKYMQKRHAEILKKGDPYYNPNLTLTRENFGLK
ncbi:MAG: glycosyltransferase, partial [Spirochaetota bacterium]|nr:glycosyltransferase [Spirochaetota bacterium]